VSNTNSENIVRKKDFVKVVELRQSPDPTGGVFCIHLVPVGKQEVLHYDHGAFVPPQGEVTLEPVKTRLATPVGVPSVAVKLVDINGSEVDKVVHRIVLPFIAAILVGVDLIRGDAEARTT
jgi:hypothetical protein